MTVTYSVTLTGGGDGAVDNVAWGTDPDDPPGPTPDCDDPATTVPCDGEQFDLPKLSIVKDADLDQANAVGDVVTFTVTVTNDGPGDYTAAEPATFERRPVRGARRRDVRRRLGDRGRRRGVVRRSEPVLDRRPRRR